MFELYRPSLWLNHFHSFLGVQNTLSSTCGLRLKQLENRLLTLGLFHSKGFGGRLLGKTDLLVAGKSRSSNSFRSRWHCALISANVLSLFIVAPCSARRRTSTRRWAPATDFLTHRSHTQNEQSLDTVQAYKYFG